MSKLQEKLKKMSKTGKSMVLAGAAFFAGLTAAQAQSTSQYGDLTGDRNSSVTFQQRVDRYELRGGVLMPKQGETIKAYEARLLRLQQQEQRLRDSLAKNMRSRLASLLARNASDHMIEDAEDTLEQHSQRVQYLSYYSAEGQQKLKTFNNKKNRYKTSNTSLGKTSAGVRRGRSYDF